jgi:hypothetical protein
VECCDGDPLFNGVNYWPMLNTLVLAIGEDLLEINSIRRLIIDMIKRDFSTH